MEQLRQKRWTWPPTDEMKRQWREAEERLSGSVHVDPEVLAWIWEEDDPGRLYRWKAHDPAGYRQWKQEATERYRQWKRLQKSEGVDGSGTPLVR